MKVQKFRDFQVGDDRFNGLICASNYWDCKKHVRI